MMDNNKHTLTKVRENERGAALVIAIFSILLVTIIGVGLVATGLSSQDISRNSRQQTGAYYVSEAGLTHAISLVTAAGRSQFTTILQSGDGVANTGDELSTRPTALTPIPAVGLVLGDGRYIVYVSDDPAETDGNPNVDTNGRLAIRSVGLGGDGATVTTEAIIGVSTGSAMLVNGNLRINGNPVIQGSGGSVHSNGILDFDGSPCASQYFSSSGTIIDPGNALGGGCVGVGVTLPNQPVIPPPTFNIRQTFYANSDYILGAIGAQAGRVYTGFGTLLHNANTSGAWKVGASEWSWDSGGRRWVHGGDALPTGTYYSEGNMTVGDSFGTSASPVTATLIAEGYIDLSGNPYMRPDYQDFSLMAGTDLAIGGNPAAGSQNFTGIHYAGHQIKFNGNPAINGVVIAANLADTNSPGCGCNPVPLAGGYMEISGNPTITYNGGLITDGSRVISWREVRY